MNRPDVFTVELRRMSDKARKSSSGEYLALRLPDEIVDLDLESGDYVGVDLRTDEVDGESVKYLLVGEDVDTRHSLKIGQRDDFNPEHFVRIPIEFTDNREGQPFHNVDKKTQVNVEVDSETGKIRVYIPRDYKLRNRQLVNQGRGPTLKKPLIAPLVNRLRDRFIDLAGRTEYSGQKFEIVPIDGLHETFIEENSGLMGRIAPARNFADVKEKHGLPEIRVSKISIFWDPQPVTNTSPDKLEEVHTERFTKKTRVILPERGGYIFETETFGGAEGGTWATYLGPYTMFDSPVRGNPSNRWRTVYTDSSGFSEREVIKIYVPTPSRGEKDGKRVQWHWD